MLLYNSYRGMDDAYDYGYGIPNTVFGFRGPAVDVNKPFIACLGAAQTFGRFQEKP